MTEVLIADLIEFSSIYRQAFSQLVIQLVVNSLCISGGFFLVLGPERLDYISTLSSESHPAVKTATAVITSIDKNFATF